MRKSTVSSLAAPSPPQPPALVSSSLALLEQAIGGRAALVAALSHAPKSREFTFILGLIGDPSQSQVPLADLCAKGGITAGELIEAYKAGEVNRAQALAIQKVGERLEAVAADTMLQAIPHEVTCPACRGTGTFTPEPTKKAPHPEPGPCEACQGIGVITQAGDLEHKKLALELGKLTSKGGGMTLAVNQQVGVFTGAAAGGSLERLQAATDAILFGNGSVPPDAASDVVEGEAVEASPAEPCEVEGDWREAP